MNARVYCSTIGCTGLPAGEEPECIKCARARVDREMSATFHEASRSWAEATLDREALRELRERDKGRARDAGGFFS